MLPRCCGKPQTSPGPSLTSAPAGSVVRAQQPWARTSPQCPSDESFVGRSLRNPQGKYSDTSEVIVGANHTYISASRPHWELQGTLGLVPRPCHSGAQECGHLWASSLPLLWSRICGTFSFNPEAKNSLCLTQDFGLFAFAENEVRSSQRIKLWDISVPSSHTPPRPRLQFLRSPQAPTRPAQVHGRVVRSKGKSCDSLCLFSGRHNSCFGARSLFWPQGPFDHLSRAKSALASAFADGPSGPGLQYLGDGGLQPVVHGAPGQNAPHCHEQAAPHPKRIRVKLKAAMK